MQRQMNAWIVNATFAALAAFFFIASVYVGRGGELLAQKFALPARR